MSGPPALSGLRKQKTLLGAPDDEVWAAYKHTFLRDSTTKKTLAHMCLMAGFFGFSGDVEQKVRQDFMKQVLSNCGIWSDAKSVDIIQKLSELI